MHDDEDSRDPEIRKSLALLKATLDNSLDMIRVYEAVRDEQGGIVDFQCVFANRAATGFYGELIGSRLLTFRPGADPAAAFAIFSNVATSGIPDQRQWHHVDGTVSEWFYQSTVRLDNGVAVTSSTITPGGNPARTSSIPQQEIIDAPGLGIAIYRAVRDQAGQIVDFTHEYINRESIAILGADFTGRLFSGHGENGILQLPDLISVIETGSGNRYIRAAAFRGRNVWFSVINTPIGEDRLIHIWEDITEHVQANERIRVTNERLQSTLDATLSFVQAFQAVRDDAGRIVDFTWVFTNKTWNQLYGDNVGKSLLQENPAVVETGLFDRFVQVTETGISVVHEQYYSHEQFHDQWFHQTIVKMQDGFVMNTEDITERKRAEAEILRLKDEAAQKATDKYQTLFGSIDQGISIIELIFDDAGTVIDYRHLEHNPVFTSMTGITNAVGKRMSELVPDLEPKWHRLIEKIYYTGEPVRVEQQVQALGKWFTTHMSRIGGDGSRLIACVYDDITSRKLAEEQQGFLLELGDILRAAPDARSLETSVTTLTLRFLHADRCYFCAIEEQTAVIRRDVFRDGLRSIAGRYPFHRSGPFHGASETGRPFAVDDIRSSASGREPLHPLVPGDDIRAGLFVPVLKAGQVVGVLIVAQHEPRAWTAAELSLAGEIADRSRSAAERALAEEALRVNRGRLRWQKEAFQSAINGASLADSLHLLTEMVAAETDGEARSAFYVANASGTGLSTIRGAGNMPDSYADAVENFPIGEDSLACGLAIPTGKPVIAADVHQEPRWEPLLSLADDHGFRACWAFPIKTKDDKAVGSLAMYFREPRTASRRDLALVAIVTQSAAVILASHGESERRSKAEAALRRSEDRLRTLSDAVPQVIWTNDEAGFATYFNQRWYEYTGLSYAGSRGPGWQRIVHPDDEPASSERWRHALATNSVFDSEFRLRGSDGSYRWFIGRNVPMQDAAGRTAGWFGSATDIHDLKLAEEALQVSRERLRITVESAVDYAILTMDVEGRVEGWSKGAENIFGYSEADVLGRSLEFIFTPEDRMAGILEQEMAEAREKGGAEDDRWHVRRDGSRFYMSGVLSPIYDGQLTGYVKVARDMTGQKAAEEQLRVSEERYRVALQSADMGAWDWDIPADEVRWNDQHFRLVGLEPEGRLVTAGFFLQFIHPDDLAAVSKELVSAVEETGKYRAEAFRIIRADGKTRWMTGFGRTVAWENGRSKRMVGVMFDITERKLMEQQKEQFIGIASHELRTPVTSIKAYAQILQEIFEERGDEASAALMRKMDGQVDRLSSLINALLDSTSITEGKLRLQYDRFDVNALVAEAVETMQRVAGDKRLELKLDAVAGVYADRERIRQVLVNFISNAIKYAPGTDRIIVSSSSDARRVSVCVQDFGMGMDTRTQDRLFEPFYRGREVSSFQGLGLGLFISAGIVRQHGGSLSVRSQPGAGSTFCFVLPLANE